MTKTIDMTGQRFGYLLVVMRTGSKNGRASWHCECDCGRDTDVTGAHLREGSVVSCGCKRDASQFGNY